MRQNIQEWKIGPHVHIILVLLYTACGFQKGQCAYARALTASFRAAPGSTPQPSSRPCSISRSFASSELRIGRKCLAQFDHSFSISGGTRAFSGWTAAAWTRKKATGINLKNTLRSTDHYSTWYGSASVLYQYRYWSVSRTTGTINILIGGALVTAIQQYATAKNLLFWPRLKS